MGRILVAFITLFCLMPVAHAADVHGVLQVVKGDVQVLSAKDGKTTKAKVGSKVFPKDTIITGKDSRAKVVMVDNNVLNLSPDSKLEIKSYEFAPEQGKKEVLLNVLYGKVRSKVEQKYDGKTSKFEVKTPTAVAGVRGTDFLASYAPSTQTSSVVTFHGEVAFGQKAPDGSMANPVAVTPGKMAEMSGNNAPPPPRELPPQQLASMDKDTNADTGGAKTDNSSRTPAAGETKQDKKEEDKGEKKEGNNNQGREGRNSDRQGGDKNAQGDGASGDGKKSDSSGGSDKNQGNANNNSGGRGQGGGAASGGPAGGTTGGTGETGSSGDGAKPAASSGANAANSGGSTGNGGSTAGAGGMGSNTGAMNRGPASTPGPNAGGMPSPTGAMPSPGGTMPGGGMPAGGMPGGGSMLMPGDLVSAPNTTVMPNLPMNPALPVALPPTAALPPPNPCQQSCTDATQSGTNKLVITITNGN